MKVLLLGATGNVGQCVLKSALAKGTNLSITVFVRSKAKLEKLFDAASLSAIKIVEGSVDDYDALTAVMKGQEACICTAGNVEQKTAFQTLFKNVAEVAAANLVGPKRLWVMAGATVLALPGVKTGLTINDLPIFSSLPYTLHAPNVLVLEGLKDKLDWNIMCPGSMHFQTAKETTAKYKSFFETAPVFVPSILLKIKLLRLLAAVFLLPQMGKFGVPYEAVGDYMVNTLKQDASHAHERVTLTFA